MRMRWAGHVARIGRRGTNIGYWWESQMVRDHWERPRRWWMDNIKIDLKEIEWDFMDWIDLAQDRDRCRALVNMVMHLQVP
jgi:hypothetical protein